MTCARHIKGAITDRKRVSVMKDKRIQRKDGWNDAQKKGGEDKLGLHEREVLTDGQTEPE